MPLADVELWCEGCGVKWSVAAGHDWGACWCCDSRAHVVKFLWSKHSMWKKAEVAIRHPWTSGVPTPPDQV